MNRDVVIYATPTITKDISYNTRDLVIDLGNRVSHPDRFNCPYANRIGQLTDYAVKKEVYNWDGIERVVMEALAHGNKVVINADW